MKRMMLIIITGLMIMFSPDVRAHHQLGLPHYLYSEEYPQIPTMVIDADAEGYTVTFSIFPGNPQPGETVRTKVYIKHSRTGEIYRKPITLSVSEVKFLRGEKEIVAPRSVRSEYNEYKLSLEFEEAEKYHFNVTFEPSEDFYEKIPFPIVIGKTNFSVIPIIFAAVFLAVFIAVGVTKKRKTKSVL